MKNKEIELIKQSFKRISRDEFAERFYSELFSIQPALRLLFPEDLGGVKRNFNVMIGSAVAMLGEPTRLTKMLKAAGRFHALAGAREEHYKTARGALFTSLVDTCDGHFSSETEAAWGNFFEELSETMKSGARSLYK